MSKTQNYYDDETFQDMYQRMKEQYAPELVTYTPVDEQTLAERISKVLRPVYDRAIEALFKGKQRSAAELDADAISRGMGSSTFVSDLKRRQDDAAAEGAQNLESEYGAKMADQLYKALDSEREKQLEADKFNAQQQNEANAKAFEAAKEMYEAYLAARKRHRGGGSGSAGSQRAQTGEADVKNGLAQAVAAARGKLAANPNGPGFYAGGDREAVRRTTYSDLPRYVKQRRQMNGDYRARELRRFREAYEK